MLKLASTLSHKMKQCGGTSTQEDQDVLLKKLWSQEAASLQAAYASGLITIGTEAHKPVEPVFLLDPSLVATHNDLLQSLHQSHKQSEPPSRHSTYKQTHSMLALARAIDDNQCEKDKDPSMPKWKRFLGSAPVSNDHACQPSMGMFTKSRDNFEGFPEYVIPDINSQYWGQVSDNPKEKEYRDSRLRGYHEQLGHVNSKLRDYLSNIIFVDMVSQHRV